MKSYNPILIAIFTDKTVRTEKPKELNVLIIGAHPDDAEASCGTAALYVAAGHNVKLISVTNGDAGHHTLGGKELAKIRKEEARKSGKILGVKYKVLGNHDGELMPAIENRRKIVKAIRDFHADIVITHRPNDYHPDHRNTAQLVLDTAYMVTVPNVCPQTPILKKNPVFLYCSDEFTKPAAFQPDVVVGIDDTIERKIDMYDCHTSQVYDWIPWNQERTHEVPEGKAERREWLAKDIKKWAENIADKYRDGLIALYGQEKGSKD